MSYQITVVVQEGKISATGSGDVPEGEHIIAGHEDASQRSLSVTRRLPDGRYAGLASAVHHKEA
jgi:hypothetical protein